jgi:hypothetical protein
MAAKRSAQVAGNLSILMARLLELWRMMWSLSREATALGFIACVLLPAFSNEKKLTTSFVSGNLPKERSMTWQSRNLREWKTFWR